MTTSEEFARSIIAGGGAGAFETALFFPLDTVKTRQQLARGTNVGTLATLRGVVRADGWRGLYRGIAAPMVSEVPRRAIKFSANGFYQRALAPHRDERPAVWLATTCGALTGATETLLHTPFETVKTQLQSPGSERGALAHAFDVARREGAAGLYRGLEAYALRQAVWNGAFFGLIAVAQRQLAASGGGGGGGSMLVNFFVGLGSGSIATCLNNPLDVAKSRLQARPGHSQVHGARWSLALVARIARAEGVAALARGLPARLYRSAPGHGVLFMAYERISTLLR